MSGISRRTVLTAGAMATLAAFVGVEPASAAPKVTDPLARSRFSGLVGSRFTVTDGAQRWAATLAEVADLQGAPPGDERRFRLAFTSDAGPDSGTFSFSRPAFSGTPLFVVAGSEQRSLTAVVNRI